MSREIGAQLGRSGWVLVKPAPDYTRATNPHWVYDETSPVTPEQWDYLQTRMRAVYGGLCFGAVRAHHEWFRETPELHAFISAYLAAWPA